MELFSHQTKEPHGEDETAVQQGKRRYKREWVKFATPCREREDNSKRNPIARVSHAIRANVGSGNKLSYVNSNNMVIPISKMQTEKSTEQTN